MKLTKNSIEITKDFKIGLDKAGEVTLKSQKTDGASEKTFDSAGEYEINGVQINGFAADNETAYKITADGVRVLWIADSSKLNDETASEIGDVDILLTTASANIKKLNSAVEPRILAIIDNPEVANEKLFAELGTKIPETVENLKIDAKNMPSGAQEFVLLK